MQYICFYDIFIYDMQLVMMMCDRICVFVERVMCAYTFSNICFPIDCGVLRVLCITKKGRSFGIIWLLKNKYGHRRGHMPLHFEPLPLWRHVANTKCDMCITNKT